MYCPYCGTTHDERIISSIEHIVPYGLGGSDSLTITTCERSNNDLGSDVDAPFYGLLSSTK
jgi:5-methylcytosine-specific restriction endonuclease McrA